MRIYINSFEASKNDLALLIERCKAGLEIISEVHMTKHGNLAIVTA